MVILSHIENTTIDGSQPSNPDSASVVAFGQGEDTTSVLCGFRITGGSGTFAYNHMIGGGVFIEHTSPMIMNNIIEDNNISATVGAAGGGILANILLTPLIIKNNIVRNNLAKSSTTSAYGGGISIWSHLYSAPGEVIVMNNLIENNKAFSPTFNIGGGINVNGYDAPNFFAYIRSNKIVGNMVDTTILQSYGGGMTFVNTHAYVENNIIAYNIAYEAAGIDNANLGGQSSTYYINNTLCYNYAVHEEGGISSFHFGQMINCIVWGNQPDQFTPWSQVLTVTHSLIGEPYSGVGNIEGNPFFLDSVYFFMENDSTLCIDAGNPDPTYNDLEDPFNSGNPMWPALGSLTNDIGHFGGPNSLWCYWEWPLSFSLPTAPALVYPSGSIDTTAIEFAWTMSNPLATMYWFEIAANNQFTNSFIDSTIADTTYLYSSLNYGESYWWRVKAYNAMGWGEFSDVGSVVVVSVEGNENLPTEYSLEQNYPNPFNPTTTIKYQIPELNLVTIKIFDVLGSEIITLVNEEKPSGFYKIDFNASRLASGIYFYRIQAGSFVDTKKMLLLK